MLTQIGIITKIKDTEKISEKFSKREFVVTDMSGNYPNPIPFQLVNDRGKLLDGFKLEDEVTVTFSLRGNESKPEDGSEPKNFVVCEAFRIVKNS